MKTKNEIEAKLYSIQAYLSTVPKQNLLNETERIAYAGSSGAVQVLEWVLEIDLPEE